MFVSGTHANPVHRAEFCRTTPSATNTHPLNWCEPCCSCLCCGLVTVSDALFTHGFYHYWFKKISLEDICWHACSKQGSSRVSELVLAASLPCLHLQIDLCLTLVQLNPHYQMTSLSAKLVHCALHIRRSQGLQKSHERDGYLPSTANTSYYLQRQKGAADHLLAKRKTPQLQGPPCSWRAGP